MDDKFLDEYTVAYGKINIDPPHNFSQMLFHKISLAERRKDFLHNFLVPCVAFASSVIVSAILIFSSAANIAADSAGFDVPSQHSPSKIISTAIVKNLLPSTDAGNFTISSLHNCYHLLERCKMQICEHHRNKSASSDDITTGCDCCK